MTLFDKLAAWLPGAGSARAETKASTAGHLMSLHLTGRPVWTARNLPALARQGFARNPIGYRCVRMIAEAAVSVPWLVYQGDTELGRHPLHMLLARPNPAQSGRALMESFYAHLQIAGDSYLEAVSADDRVGELHVLRPDRMKVVPGPDGWPQAYEYTANGLSVRFDQDGHTPVAPVLHLKLFNPADDHYGLSPLEPAAMAADVHNAASAWNKALLDNAARPSGALVYRGGEAGDSLTAEQFARLKAELADTYQGAVNAGRPMLLEGGLDWKPLSHSPKEMEYIDAKHVAAREIALAFGVPPMLLGIPGDNTYANYAEAQRSLWRLTVLPLVQRTADALTHWLAPAFGDDLSIAFDSDAVDALAQEREAVWKRTNAASFLTINEKRVALGYSPIEGGDRLAD